MYNKFKHIKFIFIFLIGLTLISHAVISHDHHTSFSYEEHTNKAHNQADMPLHCYVFTDIIADNSVIFDNFPFTVKFYISRYTEINNLKNLQKNDFEILFYSDNKIVKHSFFKKNIPARGSPFSS